LAMLLALMLVVAMIPLSASAQDISASLDFIYVDDNQVKLDKSFTVDVDDDADNVEIRTNEDLGDYNAELRVVKPGSQVELALTNANKPVDFATYAKDDKITLKLYDLDNDTPNGECVAEYVMSLNKVALNTTTNLDPNGFKYDGKGVVSATVDNDKKVIHVVLARNTQSSDEVLDQEALGAQMTVSTLDKAKIDGVTSKKVDVDAADTVTVVSESGGNQSTFTIDATYQDALDSFTITGLDGEEYEGVISDVDKNDVPDQITVILPESAICDQYGDVVDDPELAVSYVANGNITTNVSVGATAVASDGSKKVAFTGLQDGTSTVNSVLATRLPAAGGANQFYNLTVMLEESDDTAITYAQVNSTIADVDVDAKTIVAEVPTADDINGDSTGTGAELIFKTSPTVESITVGGKSMTGDNGATVETWTLNRVDLTKPQTVTVKAENGTMKQYTLTAKKVTNDTDATITAFWVSDGVNTYKAAMTGDDDITVTLPYMTTKIDGWKVYVTPASYAYATAAASNNQIVNGTTTLANLGVASTAIPVNGELTGTLVAHNKNTPKIEKKYTVHFVLTKDVKTGNELTDLDFTAQPTTNNTDKSAFRAITDENTFNAEVYTTTSADKKVGTLNIEVAPSLFGEDDLGITYQNIITDFATRDGGLAFISGKNANGVLYTPISTLDNDIASTLTAHTIKNGDKILVLGEEVARAAIVTQSQYTSGGEVNIEMQYEGKTIDQYGTLYTVEITAGKAETGTAINSMKVGNTNLTINSNGTITGKLAFSETVDAANDLTDATFIEFSLSDYARLFANADSGIVSTLFSKGDIDGDGEEDAIDSSSTDNLNNGDYKGFNNMKLAFERVNDANHSVKVYLVWGDRSNAMKALTNLTVKAEDRLTGGKSVSNYTFDLTWAAPCEDADIETFTLGGYTGVINNDSENGRTIKVQVPYDTDVTGLVANFTTSTGATVKMDAPDGIDFVSGVTSANYTNPVKLYVTSEDKDTTTMYTVTVEEGISFSDVNPGDWFYDNVMDAAQNGYVSGMGDGTFNPTGATTRAQFAAMIANAMGYEADPDVESMFPDVADNYWGKAAINFCYENGIITGYEDGTFQPEKTITRQEAAAILNNAFELAEKYGISTELFPDNGAIADWAADHVYAAKAAGLMKGDAGTGNFRPTSTITRAEAASIMMNAKNAGLIK
ncbi:MAG: S-layer homology domain-containing protein, partial [Acutalibacter sp.]